MPRNLFIVDDDELSREVLALVANEAGFTSELFSSGESILAHLALHRDAIPSALLIDFQMPGIAGDPLALRLRPICPPGTLFIVMSGSPVAPARRTAYDAFLPKPFDFKTFLAVTANAPVHSPPPSRPEVPPILAETTYHVIAGSMAPGQVRELYMLLLDDAERRLDLMRRAVTEQDRDTYIRAAHAIKGGCGMVGALELAAVASEMEENGPPGNAHPDLFLRFDVAAERLRSMLNAYTSQVQPEFHDYL